MLLKSLLLILIICAMVFVLMLMCHKNFVKYIKDNIKISIYVTIMGFSLVFYVISALCTAFLIEGLLAKAVMLIFAISPFVIGRFATYEKKKIYSAAQIFFMLLSTLYAVLIL